MPSAAALLLESLQCRWLAVSRLHREAGAGAEYLVSGAALPVGVVVVPLCFGSTGVAGRPSMDALGAAPADWPPVGISVELAAASSRPGAAMLVRPAVETPGGPVAAKVLGTASPDALGASASVVLQVELGLAVVQRVLRRLRGQPRGRRQLGMHRFGPFVTWSASKGSSWRLCQEANKLGANMLRGRRRWRSKERRRYWTSFTLAIPALVAGWLRNSIKTSGEFKNSLLKNDDVQVSTRESEP